MKKNVYILEDNEDIRTLLIYLLEEEKYKVDGFANIADFNQQLLALLPDVIVLDVMLPDGNGIAVCIKLKQDDSTKHIPVLLMSANTNVRDMSQQSRADDYISKPFDIHVFVAKINAMLT